MLRLFIISLLPIFLLSCKTEKESYIEEWSFNQSGDQFEVRAVFEANHEVELEATVPFKNHGMVKIYQDDQSRFVVDANFKWTAMNDIELEKVGALPNGSRFPSLVRGTMYAVTVADSDKMELRAYFSGGDVQTLVGIGIAFKEVDNNLPTGQLTRNFYSDSGDHFAALTFYTPSKDEDGQVLSPGGIFLVADLNRVQNGPMKFFAH